MAFTKLISEQLHRYGWGFGICPASRADVYPPPGLAINKQANLRLHRHHVVAAVELLLRDERLARDELALAVLPDSDQRRAQLGLREKARE